MSLARLLERLNPRLVRALAAFLALVLLVFRDEVVGTALLPLQTLTAQAVLALIHWAGLEAVREASAIYHPAGFAFEISRGCLGLVPAGFLVVSVLATSGSSRAKLVGLALGLPLLMAVNLARLLHLFYLGVRRPDLFDVAHQVVWQGVFVVTVFGLWLACTVGAAERAAAPRSTPGPRTRPA
jgi:exosortase/archaeosortase family protein